MPTKRSSSSDTTSAPKTRRATAAAKPAIQPVTVMRAPHSPALYERARAELRGRGLPVELSRITPVPGRQVVDVDVTPRPAVNPQHR